MHVDIYDLKVLDPAPCIQELSRIDILFSLIVDLLPEVTPKYCIHKISLQVQ